MLTYVDNVGDFNSVSRRAVFLRNMKELSVPLFRKNKLFNIKGTTIKPVEGVEDDHIDQYELLVTIEGRH